MNTRGHRFGGPWTEQKLECVRKYLHAYTTIMRRYKFHFTYIDAFAGTGYHEPKHDENTDQIMLFNPTSEETQNFLDGSARIALQVEHPFQEYIFVEKNKNRFSELKKLTDEFPNEQIEFINSDANDYLINFCNERNWKSNRVLVFLDPYGMQVSWETIKSIAETEAIDLWILFPLGTINRMLENDGQISLAKQGTLDRFFGEPDWRKVFYPLTKISLTQEDYRQKTSDIFAEIGRYSKKRLQGIFARVADNPLALYNSKNVPLYLLCFAAGNPKAAKTAVNIAQDILLKPLRQEVSLMKQPEQLELL